MSEMHSKPDLENLIKSASEHGHGPEAHGQSKEEHKEEASFSPLYVPLAFAGYVGKTLNSLFSSLYSIGSSISPLNYSGGSTPHNKEEHHEPAPAH